MDRDRDHRRDRGYRADRIFSRRPRSLRESAEGQPAGLFEDRDHHPPRNEQRAQHDGHVRSRPEGQEDRSAKDIRRSLHQARDGPFRRSDKQRPRDGRAPPGDRPPRRFRTDDEPTTKSSALAEDADLERTMQQSVSVPASPDLVHARWWPQGLVEDRRHADRDHSDPDLRDSRRASGRASPTRATSRARSRS